MARPLRIEFPGALYHVMSRGNERNRIVRDDPDRDKRLDWLRRTVETYGWRLHAFVLMNNHDHLTEERGDFLEVSRYIHLNPVRAKMVARPEAYRFGKLAQTLH